MYVCGHSPCLKFALFPVNYQSWGAGCTVRRTTELTALPNLTTPLSAPDDSLIWVADLLASLDLPPIELDDASGSQTGQETDQDDPGVVDTTAAEIAQTSQELNLPAFDYDPDQDGSVLDALFGWIGDLFSALFGGAGDSDDMAYGPDMPDDPSDDGPDPMLIPADVSADTVMNALEPDQDYLDQLEEELAALELL